MSQYLDKLAIGDSIDFKGPRGRFEYSPNMKRAIGGFDPWSLMSCQQHCLFLHAALQPVFQRGSVLA